MFQYGHDENVVNKIFCQNSVIVLYGKFPFTVYTLHIQTNTKDGIAVAQLVEHYPGDRKGC